VDDVAHKLLLLKATFPQANVSHLCSECTNILLLELPQFEEAVQQVRAALHCKQRAPPAQLASSSAVVCCTLMQPLHNTLDAILLLHNLYLF
jgi:hypothetical protein